MIDDRVWPFSRPSLVSKFKSALLHALTSDSCQEVETMLYCYESVKPIFSFVSAFCSNVVTKERPCFPVSRLLVRFSALLDKFCVL